MLNAELQRGLLVRLRGFLWGCTAPTALRRTLHSWAQGQLWRRSTGEEETEIGVGNGED